MCSQFKGSILCDRKQGSRSKRQLISPQLQPASVDGHSSSSAKCLPTTLRGRSPVDFQCHPVGNWCQPLQPCIAVTSCLPLHSRNSGPTSTLAFLVSPLLTKRYHPSQPVTRSVLSLIFFMMLFPLKIVL